MAFEWGRFLEQHRIPVQQSGANVSRDHVAVHCPFCGPSDPSFHMSVNLSGKGWRCWRHPEHRGKSPARLVQALISCTSERAKEIVGQSVFIPDDFMARVTQQFNPTPAVAAPPIKLPPEFKEFKALPSARPYENYLLDRGFGYKTIGKLTKRYSMYYATRGPYAGRIIFLIERNGAIVSWTGRTISKTAELRYKALSTDPERADREGSPVALGAISHYLLWHDQLERADADTLIFCEGPFDALKVDVLGRPYGVRATCFFTSAPTESQIELMHEICPQFKRRVLMLDRGTEHIAMRIGSMLSNIGVITRQTPKRLKDPGEFDRETFSSFLLALDRATA